jgi:DNA-binding transcriptional ArsR family regulator
MATAKKATKKPVKKTRAKPGPATGTSRDETMQRAAVLRAQIIGFLNRATDKTAFPVLEKELAEFLKTYKAPRNALQQALETLEQAGQITSEKQGRSRMYWGPKTQTPLQIVRTVTDHPAAKQPRVKRAVAVPGQDEFKFDIIKKTGRVRIRINQLVIDIGVIDE